MLEYSVARPVIPVASAIESRIASHSSLERPWAIVKIEYGQSGYVGRQMAAFRGISHCYQRPTYADWPYSIFTMAHGRSKEECDAILDAIAGSFDCIEDRATLYSSTEFKKVRLLYFTDDFKAWEREHAGV